MVKNNTSAKTTGNTPHCPYCDQDVQEAKLPWCKGCGVKLQYCPECGKPVSREAESCPHCGKKYK